VMRVGDVAEGDMISVVKLYQPTLRRSGSS